MLFSQQYYDGSAFCLTSALRLFSHRSFKAARILQKPKLLYAVDNIFENRTEQSKCWFYQPLATVVYEYTSRTLLVSSQPSGQVKSPNLELGQTWSETHHNLSFASRERGIERFLGIVSLTIRSHFTSRISKSVHNSDMLKTLLNFKETQIKVLIEAFAAAQDMLINDLDHPF